MLIIPSLPKKVESRAKKGQGQVPLKEVMTTRPSGKEARTRKAIAKARTGMTTLLCDKLLFPISLSHYGQTTIHGARSRIGIMTGAKRAVIREKAWAVLIHQSESVFYSPARVGF